MLGAISGRIEWVLAVLACVACAVFACVSSADSAPGHHHAAAATHAPAPSKAAPAVQAAPAPAPVAPPAKPSAKPATHHESKINLHAYGAGTTLKETIVRAAPSSKSPALSMLRAGITLPFGGVHGGWIRILTPCETSGWVRWTNLQLIVPAKPTGQFKDALFVIDAGHGGTESGAIGPDGVQEKDVNLGIALRLAKDLKGSRVVLTRTGNYFEGLRYRALIASKLNATAFLSMHNNSGPTVPSLRPGTQAWHQIHSPASAKLANIIWRNLYSTLARYKVHFVRAPKIGSLGRVGDKGHDYYAVLRESTVPSVIVESLFVSNRAEQRLLQHADVREAIASTTALSLREYVAEGGGKQVRPYPVKLDKGGGVPAGCHDPA